VTKRPATKNETHIIGFRFALSCHLKHLRDPGVDVGIWWYADCPSCYCGDGIPATVEKSNKWLDARARAFAKVIRVIKDDKETKRLQNEFFARI
jgi:hypothetical protein